MAAFLYEFEWVQSRRKLISANTGWILSGPQPCDGPLPTGGPHI